MKSFVFNNSPAFHILNDSFFAVLYDRNGSVIVAENNEDLQIRKVPTLFWKYHLYVVHEPKKKRDTVMGWRVK